MWLRDSAGACLDFFLPLRLVGCCLGVASSGGRFERAGLAWGLLLKEGGRLLSQFGPTENFGYAAILLGTAVYVFSWLGALLARWRRRSSSSSSNSPSAAPLEGVRVIPDGVPTEAWVRRAGRACSVLASFAHLAGFHVGAESSGGRFEVIGDGGHLLAEGYNLLSPFGPNGNFSVRISDYDVIGLGALLARWQSPRAARLEGVRVIPDGSPRGGLEATAEHGEEAERSLGYSENNTDHYIEGNARELVSEVSEEAGSDS